MARKQAYALVFTSVMTQAALKYYGFESKGSEYFELSREIDAHDSSELALTITRNNYEHEE